jgi:hypothetical protein
VFVDLNCGEFLQINHTLTIAYSAPYSGDVCESVLR